ncbi:MULTISPECIES: hypothetical protein [Calothrix]|uniref:Transposase n=2 Tax=Calothrix TaxID=1186 RepID=A0ABR8ABG5_9CYAN|nr:MULTISPECIES: hypothetical protein [Calothrix]MBD2197044.1 hypothetical protein [Calothrix parietina FACHB-288]MBD2203892.1 hypothetical protein [Calothrix sp. FACHB-168]MBD2218323.1 hypothetical protein [Calothrix sp. FACHB-1219]MBD2225735.1 hypothetical protein [Calothrix anomala FACHB-343]
MLETLIPLVINKSVEIILGLLLEKFWAWVLKDNNYQRLNQFLKMQVLALYLNWVLLKKPLKYLPESVQESNSEIND